jgi:hypothetical protein
MNTMTKILIAVTIATAVLSVPVVATAGNLTEADKAHLIFMRSEEKLARDVYLTLAEIYPNQPVFLSIATKAEQTHTDKMLDMLIKFKIEDPEPSTEPDNLPPENQIGVFENYYFAEYFTYKFEGLISTASRGELEALNVGALIEELDMSDINYCNAAFYEYYPKELPQYPNCGGLSATEIRSLINSLGNLLAGSENHLCAFISQIGPMIFPSDCYECQYLSQQEVWDIVDAQCPEFSSYVCDPEQH